MVSTIVEAQPVVGLEVHAQLLTDSKMFCGCSARYFDAPENSHVCAVCGGMPGALPVINRKAVRYAILTALALNCRVPDHCKFDRKNYSYPDIPKGYQISQYDMPIGQGGWLDYQVGDRPARCGITRVHLEEDTGKSLHTNLDGREVSLIDYNRSGVPLLEIVTEPELDSPEAAREFFAALRRVLMYLGVCDGRLQEGSMRADVNVSLRSPSGALGTKVEIKNLNSFRAVQRALEYEIERQRGALASGAAIVQETRGWSERQEITVSQRTKEYAHDYRYFPEPDLPALAVARDQVEELAASLPELPLARRARYEEQYGLSPHNAAVLTDERELADFFEEVLRLAPDTGATRVANWLTQDVLGQLHESHRTLASSPLTPASVGRLLTMVEGRRISRAAAKQVLEEMVHGGEDPEAIAGRLDLSQIVDEGALERLVDEALEGNPDLVATYLSGKTRAIDALVGKVMGRSKGKANPQAVREILARKLVH